MSEPESILLFRGIPRGLDRPALRKFAIRLRDEVAAGRAFCCMLTRDKELQRLNSQFLAHDYPTDVLSFPSGEAEGQLGDLAISYDRAVAQAAEFEHAVEDEIRILMLHGLLHLSGMDHESDRGNMRRAEIAWRRKLDRIHEGDEWPVVSPGCRPR